MGADSTDRSDLVRSLIVDWLRLACVNVSEHSGNLVQDWKAKIVEAQVWAERLDIEWDDDVIPDYVSESIEHSEED